MIYRERFICKEIYVFYYYYYLYRVVFSPLRDCFYKRRFSDQENIFFLERKKKKKKKRDSRRIFRNQSIFMQRN